MNPPRLVSLAVLLAALTLTACEEKAPDSIMTGEPVNADAAPLD